MKVLRTICCAAVLGAAVAPMARAQDPSGLKTTMLTFSGPVSMPGMTLPAGTYRFQLADPTTSRKVIVVHNQDGTKPYGMFLTMPNERLEPSEKPVVMFSETAKGSAPAVRAWFYPGERTGYEFIYPKAQAISIAKATHQPVLTGDSASGTSVAAIKDVNPGRVDENGNVVDEHNNRVAAASTTAPRNSAAASTTAGTSGQANTASPTEPAPRRARTLPRTASALGLFELLSGLSLAGAFGVNQLRRRMENR